MESNDGRVAPPYVLGIDLGTNSVGWAATGLEGDRPSRLIGSGARVFEAGMDGDVSSGNEESRNLKRRQMRSQRRQTERRARRQRKVLHLLQRYALLPENRSARPETMQNALNALDVSILKSDWFTAKQKSGTFEAPHQMLPYILRASALEEPLPPCYLGRALYHLAQRRGFLSNRKAPPKKDEKPGEVQKGINELRDAMGGRTLGQYFAQLDPSERRIRQRWTHRSMYEDEFKRIWNAQAPHYAAILTPERYRQLHRAVFYQRPLWFPPELVGRCELEPGQPRAAKYLFLAQRCRLLQDVNNLRLQLPDGSERSLTTEERMRLTQELELKGDQSLSQVRKKLLKLPNGSVFSIERGGEKKLRGNRTTSALYGVFGERWLEMSATEHEQALHDVVSIQDEEALKRRGINRWKLSEETAAKFKMIPLEPDYFKFSRPAMDKLLPLLENGVTYAEARRQLYPEKFEAREPLDSLPRLDVQEARQAVGEIRNPAVIRSLTELRKVVNAIVRRYGKPEQIRIELARDLKNPRKARQAIADSMRENEKAREDMKKKILEEAGFANPSGTDIRKALLWDECGGICPYTGRPIDFRHLFGSESQFDIEHIIPYEHCFDSSFKNLTLCYQEENRHVKGGRTPWEAYHADTVHYEEILDRVRRFHSAAAREKLRRFQMTETEASEFVSKFVDRQMNDTRYASRLAAKYVAMLYGGLADDEHARRVRVTSGGITAALRKAWLLNGILNDGPTSNGGAIPKTRDDHRHHAVDAVAISLTSDATIQQLSRASQEARQRGHRRPSVEAPWGKDTAEFVESVRRQIAAVIVSRRVSRKVSGALHKETFYSPAKGPEKKTYLRVELRSLSESDVMAEDVIVDSEVRKLVQTKLSTLGGGEPKNCFATPESFPCFLTREGRTIPIRKVRIRQSVTTRKLRDGRAARYVKPGGNHHVEIFAESDGHGIDKRWDTPGVVTMMEAYARLKNHEPIVKKQLEEPWAFKFSLAADEILECDDGPDKRRLLVVRSISEEEKTGSVKVELAAINDGRRKDQIKKSRQWITKSPNELRKWHARKVVVTPLGETHEAND